MSYDSRLQDVILEKFWRMSPDQGAVINSNINKPDIVYHYTSRDACVSVFENLIKGRGDSASGDKCGFAFTDYRFLNDNKEIAIGLKMAKMWLRNSPGDLEKLVPRILRALSARAKSKFVPHILSLSLSRDCAVNWMTYTSRKDGGFAIGLRHDLIEKAVAEFNSKAEINHDKMVLPEEYSRPLIFHPCIYCPQSILEGRLRGKKYDLFNNAYISLLDQSFAGIGQYLYDREDDYESCVYWCVERLLQVICLVKSDEFRFENEWRLVLRPELLKNGVDTKVLGGKARAVPRGLNLSQCITTLCASPHGDRDRLRLLGDFQMQRLGRKAKTLLSDSSYNGK